MKAIVNTAPGKLEWRELPLPQPGPGQVRIRTLAVGICATDLEMIAGWERTGFPAVPGHEWCGRVDAVGEGCDRGLIGALCVAENVLSDGGEVGFEHAGGYAECFLTEADKIHRLPDHYPPHVAPLIEPLAVVVRGLKRLAPRPTLPTLVFGDGPIGLLCVAALKRCTPGPLTLVGGRSARLELARKLGADRTVNYHDTMTEMTDVLRDYAGAAGYPQVIEASGSAAAMAMAMDLASPDGRILVLGDYGTARADFAWNDLLHGELTLIGSNASAGAWAEAVQLATNCPDMLAPLVTHLRPAAEFADGMELMRTRHPDVIKIVLQWEQRVMFGE